MGQNILHTELQNNSGNTRKYCSKCLSVLGDDMVVDGEENVFCCESCRKDFHWERRQDMDDLIRELF